MRALGNKKEIKFYQYNDPLNVGDNLGRPLLEHFLPHYKIEQVLESHPNKLCCIGSVMSKVRDGDVVWGVGSSRPIPISKRARFLSVRGRLSRALVMGSYVPEVYGDPGLLFSLMYKPRVKKIPGKVGYVPHYVDKHFFEEQGIDFIDVALPWKEFIKEILKCEHIVSSSLHGIVLAEAYGIPATWVMYSDKIMGGKFKFHDYLTGTGREVQEPGPFPPIKNLVEIQRKLIKALTDYYD